MTEQELEEILWYSLRKYSQSPKTDTDLLLLLLEAVELVEAETYEIAYEEGYYRCLSQFGVKHDFKS